MASVLAPSGTFTISDNIFQVTWDSGTQGYFPDPATSYLFLPQINGTADIENVLVAAIARTISMPTAADVFAEPKFWIKSASLEVIVLNPCQMDCDVFFYPWVARYDSSSLQSITNQSMVIEEKAGATTTFADPVTPGWTPFQSKSITEAFRLGRPTRVHLQGGQSFRYHVKDLRPLYVNYARIQNTDTYNAGWANRCRGCVITARGSVVNDNNADPGPIVNLGFGALNIQLIKRYHWVASPSPYHFSDIVPSANELGTITIVQPQTGGITTGPVVAGITPP